MALYLKGKIMKIAKVSIFVICITLLGCNSGGIGSLSTTPSGIESNTSWPYKIIGHLDIIDAAVGDSDSDTPDWIIGSITNPHNNEDILVEFKSGAAQSSGYTMDFNIKNPVTLWVNESVSDYYQVDRVE